MLGSLARQSLDTLYMLRVLSNESFGSSSALRIAIVQLMKDTHIFYTKTAILLEPEFS